MAEHGGARDGAGRKTNEAAKSIKEAIGAIVDSDRFGRIIDAIATAAENGDVKAAAFISDRFYGKPKEAVEQDLEVKVVVEYLKPKITEADEGEDA